MEAVPQPISDAQAEAMNDAIFLGLGHGAMPLVEGCDHTLKHSRAWAEGNRINFEQLKAWLHANHGFCDCEVLFNVMPDEEQDGATA